MPLLGLLVLSAPTFAVERYYNPALAGCTDLFSDTNCWTTGIVPGISDTARFDSGALPASPYTIDFNAGVTNSNAWINNDTVIWDLGANTYTLSSDLQIAYNASDISALTVQNGEVSADRVYMGNWGMGGTGSLSIVNGGKVSDSRGMVIGTATVDGAGSSWIHSSNFAVGSYGNGSLSITNGGTVSNYTGNVGDRSDNNGTVTVDGAGSSWSNSSTLYLGYSGTGSLSITNGGTVSGQRGYLGYNSSANGTATVDGAGSTWTNSSNFAVGNSGTGNLSITNGGTVSNSGYGYAGSGSGSNGTVTVDGSGSNWTSSNDLFVGYNGTGNLSITNGGTVSSQNGYLGRSNGNGTVTVDGAGSNWINTKSNSSLYVGYSGAGSLSIVNGGVVSNNGYAYLGYASGGNGTVNIDGAGSTWSSGSSLFVGGDVWVARGTGSVMVSDGGTLSVGGDLRIYSGGSLTVDNANLSYSRYLISEGNVDLINHTLNKVSSLTGQTTLDARSKIITSGGGANTTLGGTITNGGTIEAKNGGDITMGAGTMYNAITRATNTGSVTIENGATVNGGFIEAADAGSQVDVQSGGTIENAIVQAFNGANLNIDGTIDGGSVRIFADGTLTGAGTIHAQLFNTNGGVVNVGNSPGTMNVDDYEQDQYSALLVEIAGLDQGAVDGYDWLNVSNTAELDGMLDIDLLGGFTVSAGDVFDILTAVSITGTFDTILGNPGEGLRWDIEYLFDEIGSVDVVRLTANVPIPAAVWLFGSALGLLFWIRRKFSVSALN